MKTIEIPISQGQYLAKALEAIGYDTIPSNVIFDKTLTGIGATHMEINAKRHSIIIEPNVPVILGKSKKHAECLPVVKGVKDSTIEKYLLNESIQYKKILTTPESFSKISKIALKIGLDIHNSYFCLFDECEKISQDYDYRESIAFPITDFFQFRQKAFISATPTGLANKHLEKLGFTSLKVSPEGFDHKVNLELITTNVFMRSTTEKLQQLSSTDESCIFVFYNSIRGIKQIIDQFPAIQADSAIFCSDSRYNELKTEGYIVQKQVDDSSIKKFNFLTSRYYSAVDFNLSVCPDIVMLTNQILSPHSTIDPLSEAIQIQGRFRTIQPNGKRFRSLCHITDLVKTTSLTSKQIDKTLQQWYKSVQELKKRHSETDDNVEKEAILHEFRENPIFPYLSTPNFESKFTINIFSLINLHYRERVKECYCSSEALIEMYENANYFHIAHTDAFDYLLSFSELDSQLKHINKKTPQKDQIQAVVSMLESGTTVEQILCLFRDRTTADQYVNIEMLIESVQLLGIDIVRAQKTFAAIEKKFNQEKLFQISEAKRFSLEVIQLIEDEFIKDMNSPISKEQVKQRLQKIYESFDFIKKSGNQFTVTLSTIEEYFQCKSNNQTRTYTLTSILPNLKQKLTD